ncbi:HEAT repeat domain-containing protein [Zunongwangia endophytica]|uniref:HEAT repeat domain-containing protein n=1 Tax=Zunongwangia endophytica TaxID=1808945 RepID=A0ABV8HEP8_9FLAO|nr:HEAT repeat domain-containing protein [Zunongwangia endophytica]MDN3593696.1 HEAT repeat domain-containing protein [Zunongwangia endophytica]
MAVIQFIDLQWIFRYFPDGLPFVIKVNILMTFIFLIFTIIFVGFILLLRLYKNFRVSKKKAQQLLLQDILNSYLFDEEFNHRIELDHFEQKYLSSSLEIKVAIKEILLFHSNIKGESAEQLRELFIKWKLDKFCIKQLSRGAWYTKSRAIYSLSEMLIDIELQTIKPLLNHKKDEVRQQAQLYFIKLAEKEPLLFMDHLKKPLTIWEEIYIEDALRNEYHGEIPDFSKWLNSGLDSVVEFAIRMIAKFNQFENIPALLPLLDHDAESVRKEAIRCFYTLEYIEVVDLLLEKFKDESHSVKKTILEAIKRLGNYDNLLQVADKIGDSEWELKIIYYNLLEYFKPEEKKNIYNLYEEEKARLL